LIRRFLSRLSSSVSKRDTEFKKSIKRLTGYTPGNLALYHQAFAHSSQAIKKQNKSTATNNERLEFLGDAVLGAIIAEHLFKLYPKKDEGFLTQVRSKIVNGQSLHQLALKFGLDQLLKATLSIREKTASSAYGDAFEAFIGAIYLDKGYLKTQKFVVNKVLKFHVDIDTLVNTNEDYKSTLQIHAQKNKQSLEYRLLSENMQGKTKTFTVQVFLNQQPYVSFEHFSKRVAEQKAAQLTLELLKTEADG
jgi:ribonuclease III